MLTGPSQRSKRRLFEGLLSVGLVATVGMMPAVAAPVTGVLTGYENATPIANYDLHFENQKTRDLYMAPTNAKGEFGAELPPGVYEVRGDHGAILAHGIIVGGAPVALGNVNELAPYAPARLFERQVVASSILDSPAPSTAPILTRDTTAPLPPEITVSKLNPETALQTAMDPNGVNSDAAGVSFEGNCLGSPCSKQPVPPGGPAMLPARPMAPETLPQPMTGPSTTIPPVTAPGAMGPQ